MRKHFFSRRLVLAVLFLGVFTLPLSAQGFFSKLTWFANGSILFFPEDNGMHSDPMPILPSLGLGASYPLTENFALELTLDFYTTHYGFALGRPVAAAIENRSARVIGSLLAFQAVRSFEVTSFMTARVYGGPAADLRIVLLAEDLNSGDSAARGETRAIRNYFWSKGRWLMPVVGGGADFVINSRFSLGVDLRLWIPVYRLWSGENLPFIEGWRFSPGVRLTIH